MVQRRFYQGLKGKLILIFLAIGIIPLVVAAVISVWVSSNSLEAEAYAKLDAIHEIKEDQLKGYFSERKGDLLVLADNLMTRQAMRDFSDAFPQVGMNQLQKLYIDKNPHPTGKKEEYDYAPDGSTYSAFHKKYHPIFRKYLREYGYYDIFLVDLNGNIVYTVFKELDYATNLLTGKYEGENIATVFREIKNINKTNKNDLYKIVDFARYAPSHGAPASFIATPIYDKGIKLGVLIFQMPIDKVNDIMHNIGDSGKSIDVYLVGKDHLMRNDSRLTDIKKDGSDVLNEKKKIDTVPVVKAFESNERFSGIFKDYRGLNVLGQYKKINLLGLKWILVVEIDDAEAFSAIYGSSDYGKTEIGIVWLMVIVAGIMIVIVIFIGYFIGNSLAKPIIQGAQFAQAISQKDLTQTLVIKKNNDEVGELSQALVSMNDNLKLVLNDILEVSSTVAATSEEINAAANNLAEGSQNMAASVEETTASTEELTSSIKLVSDQTLSMQEKSKHSLKEAQTYKETMKGVSEEMVSISESTEKIGDIVSVINDIADQTNLLSLNAAIEAARAGEHGRGFAVVADAISTLATRSAESTKEIDKLIVASVAKINKGVDSVKMSSESFDVIIGAIDENNNVVNDITKSMEEQHLGSEQIQNATEEINNLTQTVSASAEEMASSTTELQSQAEQLNGIVGTFRLDKKSDMNQSTKALTI